MPRTVLLRCSIDVKQAGQVLLKLNQPIEAISTWLDSRPTPTPGPDEPISLTVGKHRLVFGVKVDSTNGQFGMQIVPAESRPAAVEILATFP